MEERKEPYRVLLSDGVGEIIEKALVPMENNFKDEWKIGNEVVVSDCKRPTLR